MKKFIIIKTESQGYFITDNVEGRSYFNSEIPKMKFDGTVLQKAYRDGWYRLADLPKTVFLQDPPTYINGRWELKEGYPVSNLTPKILKYMDEDDERIGLYNYKNDIVEGEFKQIDFDYDLIEVNKFFDGKPKYPYSNKLIDELCTNRLLLLEKECFIEGKSLYGIVRNYVKRNIDPKYAVITSDYNFCFTVEKVIELSEPKSYLVKTGNKRKSSTRMEYTKTKRVIVFEAAPEPYNNYPVLEGISASSYEELEKKIEEYLKNLIDEINKPLKECHCCKGTGVVLTNERVI